jgi:hypothetical protein
MILEIWGSNEPIGEDRSRAKPIHTFRGETDDGEELKHSFGLDIGGRYVQIRTIESPSWVGWTRVELQAR